VVLVSNHRMIQIWVCIGYQVWRNPFLLVHAHTHTRTRSDTHTDMLFPPPMINMTNDFRPRFHV
jgi:hypothetical protein